MCAISELEQKVQKSIERLKAFEPEEGYYLAFSGGKDSAVCKALLDMSGCKYDATYRVTSVDPPELVRFIKNQHPDVIREVPRDDNGRPITMWNLIPRKLYPPTRAVRYCCQFLKESGGDGRMVVTGVRWGESKSRAENQGEVTIISKTIQREYKDIPGFATKKGGIILTNDNVETRKMVEQCYKRHKTTVNPIIDWSDEDVWEFIKQEKIPYCTLYDEGFKRLGCVGCPLAQKKNRSREFSRWPKYKDSYIRAFDKMLENRRKRNEKDHTKMVWRVGGFDHKNATGKDVFNWWMEYDVLPGQISWFDEEEGEDSWDGSDTQMGQ